MKQKLLILITAVLAVTSLLGQNEEFKKLETGNWLDLSIQALNIGGEVISLDKVDQLPEFPGGFDSLATFLGQILIYPESAIEDSIEGRVYTKFMVDSTGHVREVEIVKSVRGDLDSTCIYGITKIPDWEPGISSNGEPAEFKLILPISFILKEETTRHNNAQNER